MPELTKCVRARCPVWRDTGKAGKAQEARAFAERAPSKIAHDARERSKNAQKLLAHHGHTAH